MLTEEAREAFGEAEDEETWAALNELHPRTLRQWKRSPRFRTEWDRRLHAQMTSPDVVQRVLTQLLAEVDAGRVPASAFSQFSKYLKATNSLDHSATEKAELSELSDPELFQLIVDAAALRGWTVIERPAERQAVVAR